MADTGHEVNSNARTWGMLCHLSVLSGYLIPFGNIIGPLIVWQIKKTEHPFIDDQGKEVLNFQISMLILMAISVVLWLVVIGIFVTATLGLLNLIFTIIGAVQSNKGEPYRYPFNFRLIS